MSEAATKLAKRIFAAKDIGPVESFGEFYSRKIDAAVAPLFDFADRYAGHRMTCCRMLGKGGCDCGYDRDVKALDPWRK